MRELYVERCSVEEIALATDKSEDYVRNVLRQVVFGCIRKDREPVPLALILNDWIKGYGRPNLDYREEEPELAGGAGGLLGRNPKYGFGTRLHGGAQGSHQVAGSKRKVSSDVARYRKASTRKRAREHGAGR